MNNVQFLAALTKEFVDLIKEEIPELSNIIEIGIDYPRDNGRVVITIVNKDGNSDEYGKRYNQRYIRDLGVLKSEVEKQP